MGPMHNLKDAGLEDNLSPDVLLRTVMLSLIAQFSDAHLMWRI